MNDHQNDFTNYYDEPTFKAFNAVSPRPHWGEPIALDKTLIEQQQEVWGLLQQADTFVFIAGHEEIEKTLEKAFSQMAGSDEAWKKLKQHLIEEGRWRELIY
jgi:ferredoxin--NADP+ reductase